MPSPESTRGIDTHVEGTFPRMPRISLQTFDKVVEMYGKNPDRFIRQTVELMHRVETQDFMDGLEMFFAQQSVNQVRPEPIKKTVGGKEIEVPITPVEIAVMGAATTWRMFYETDRNTPAGEIVIPEVHHRPQKYIQENPFFIRRVTLRNGNPIRERLAEDASMLVYHAKRLAILGTD